MTHAVQSAGCHHGASRRNAIAVIAGALVAGVRAARVERTALATRRLARSELKGFSDWNDGRPETELNFKF